MGNIQRQWHSTMVIFDGPTEPTPMHHFSYLTEVSILAKQYSWGLSLGSGDRDQYSENSEKYWF